MRDKQFDHIISNKLNSLRADVSQADWNALQSKIEIEMQSDAQFDQIVGRKLTALRADANHADWDALNTKIEMDVDTRFDSTITDKVAEFSIGVHSSPDWESFSQKLNQTREFDQTVKQKLNQISTSKVSEHWLLLQERLQGIRNLKQSILRFKLGESLLMMTLFFCFISVSHYIIPSNTHSIAPMAVIDGKEKSKLIVGSNGQDETTKQITKASANTIHTQKSDNTLPNVSTRNGAEVAQLVQSIAKANEFGNQLSPLNTEETMITLVNEASVSSHRSKSSIEEKTVVVSNQSKIAVQPLLPILTNTVVKDQSALIILNKETSLPKNVVSQLDDNHSRLSRFALHTIVGAGVDKITTPDDERFDFDGYQHYASNSNVGLRLSYDIKNWSFETGLSLEHKGYKPKYLQDTIRVQSEAVVISLDAIDFEMISVPLIVKRSIALKDKLSMYGIAGLEYVHISKESYSFNEKSTVLSGTGKDLKSVSDLEYKVNSPVIIDNSINYTIGLGLLKAMNPMVDVYGQTLYRGQMNSTGIGINQDKFSSLTLQAGIKVKLANRN